LKAKEKEELLFKLPGLFEEILRKYFESQPKKMNLAI
jgi:hypothetical protein